MKIFQKMSLVAVCVLMIAALAVPAPADELIVTETGNVGIGTANPARKLSVYTTTSSDGVEFKSNKGWVGVWPATLPYTPLGGYNGLIQQDDNAIIFSGSAVNTGALVIAPYAQATSGLRILASNGNVGIADANPTHKLGVYVKNSLDGAELKSPNGWIRLIPATLPATGYNGITQLNDNGIIFSAGTVGTGAFVIAPWASSTSGLRILASNGNVGIGIASPQDKLDVNGYVRANGTRLTSDARWKENVETIDNSLDRVAQLRGVSYDWIDKSRGEGRQLGVIAQEVEQVFPEVVSTDSQGYKSVEYAKLVAPLIEAVKALKSENERLASENQVLKSSMEDILARVAALEKKAE